MTVKEALSRMNEIARENCLEELDKAHLKNHIQNLPANSTQDAVIDAISNAILEKIKIFFNQDETINAYKAKTSSFTPLETTYTSLVYENVKKAISESPELLPARQSRFHLPDLSTIYNTTRIALFSLLSLFPKYK